MQEGVPKQIPKQEKKPLVHPILSTQEIAKLPQDERKELIENTSKEILTFFSEHAVEYKNVGEMYDALRGQNLIVRREDPESLLESVADNEPLHISFPEGERYSNAVIWSGEQGSKGLDNAYNEGYGQANSIVAVMGFKAEHMKDIIAVEDAEQRFAGLDRTFVRSVQGDVSPDDIIFVTVRVPAFAFPQKDMTETELDRIEESKQPQFIHRGYLFTKNLTKQ